MNERASFGDGRLVLPNLLLEDINGVRRVGGHQRPAMLKRRFSYPMLHGRKVFPSSRGGHRNRAPEQSSYSEPALENIVLLRMSRFPPDPLLE